MTIAEEIDKRLRMMSAEGYCAECMEHPITQAKSAASKCAKDLGLCRRCYDKKHIRNRRRKHLRARKGLDE